MVVAQTDKALCVNPLNDFFFRFLIGSEGNEDICSAFVNAVLNNAGFAPVKGVVIKNPFNLKEEAEGKESITDIKAEGGDGRLFDIEVQTGGHDAFEKRTLFYWSKIYSAQLPSGRFYSDLNPVVVINLLDFLKWPDIRRIHSCFMLLEKNVPEFALSGDLIINFIEAPKFGGMDAYLDSGLSRWLKYLRREGRGEEVEMKILTSSNRELSLAHEQYKRFTGTPEYVEAYEARQKWRLDRLSDIAAAERRGKEQGMELNARKTALNMLKEGLSAEQAARITGLSLAEIEKIKE